MLPAKTASSSQSMDAQSHPTGLRFTERDEVEIREAVWRLPPYPKTDQHATDQDLKNKHRLLRTMVMFALMHPECVPSMYEAYLNHLNKGSQIIGPNQEAESKSLKGSQTSLPKQTHSKCEKSKRGPSVQENSPQCVDGARANPCPTRGQHASSKLQHQAVQSQKEGMTQQPQPKTQTNDMNKEEAEESDNPSESMPLDCGPVSPGDWLEICDVQPTIKEDIVQAHDLFFEIPLGCVTMRIITRTKHLEHVTVGDRLRVKSVTFNKQGELMRLRLVKRFKGKDVVIQTRLEETQILGRAESECLPDDEVTAPMIYQ